MQIDWVELSRVIPYAGVAILVIAVVVYLLDRQDKRDKALEVERSKREKERELAQQASQERQDRKDAERDERFLAAMAERDTRFQRAYSDMAEHWQEVIVQDRMKQTETATVIGRELERLSALVSLTNVLLERHDQWERAVWDSSRARRSGDTGPLGEKK